MSKESLKAQFEALSDKQKEEFKVEVKEDFEEKMKQHAAEMDPVSTFATLLISFNDQKLIQRGIDYAKGGEK